MSKIKTGTLIVAIQAIAAELRILKDGMQDGGEPEEYEILQDWQDAADDLEEAYDELAKTQLNLPPYDELVGG